MSLSSQYKTDENKEINGVAVTFPPNKDGSIPTFYVARMNEANPQYAARIAALMKPYKRQIDAGTLPDAKMREITKEAFLSTVLKGWQNVELSDVTGDKNDIGFADFNKVNSSALMTNLPAVYLVLLQDATDLARFLQEELEEEAKN